MVALSATVWHMNRCNMIDIEDTIEMHAAKEKAYNEGMFTGFLFGLPLGTVVTIILALLTSHTWLPYIK